MKCPVCSEMQLIMSDRQGIEIDYCPQCRGVWLDRGELDKLIERSLSTQAAEAPARAPSQPAPVYREERSHPQHDPRQQGYYKEGYGQKKKKNLLSELFDF